MREQRGQSIAVPAATALIMGLLVVARTFGAGPYGGWAIPVLVGLFVLTAVLAGRAAHEALRRLPRPVGAVGAGLAGGAGFVVGVWSWGSRPAGEPLLPLPFAVTAALALSWVAASRGASTSAKRTAVVAVAFLALSVAVDH